MFYKSCVEQSVLTLTSKLIIFGEFIKNRNSWAHYGLSQITSDPNSKPITKGREN